MSRHSCSLCNSSWSHVKHPCRYVCHLAVTIVAAVLMSEWVLEGDERERERGLTSLYNDNLDPLLMTLLLLKSGNGGALPR